MAKPLKGFGTWNGTPEIDFSVKTIGLHHVPRRHYSEVTGGNFIVREMGVAKVNNSGIERYVVYAHSQITNDPLRTHSAPALAMYLTKSQFEQLITLGLRLLSEDR